MSHVLPMISVHNGQIEKKSTLRSHTGLIKVAYFFNTDGKRYPAARDTAMKRRLAQHITSDRVHMINSN